MTARDQMVIKALPGNNQCVDCGMKNPDWASVSFGTIFCLECSGVHRYVHFFD
jgi:Putative GTPase activating protein for Arf